jgi:hypothetical protein
VNPGRLYLSKLKPMNDRAYYIKKIYDEASTLPLRDTAFLFWLKASDLDHAESIPPAPAIPGTDAETQSAQIATAHEATTLARLKRTHPTASDEEAKEAIKSAARLYQHGFDFYKDTGHLGRDVGNAERLARAENPDFQDATYHRLGWNLGWVVSR